MRNRATVAGRAGVVLEVLLALAGVVAGIALGVRWYVVVAAVVALGLALVVRARRSRPPRHA